MLTSFSSMPRAKILLRSVWVLSVCSVFPLLMAGAVYFAWEQGWFHFAFKATLFAIVALAVAGAINYWSEHR